MQKRVTWRGTAVFVSCKTLSTLHQTIEPNYEQITTCCKKHVTLSAVYRFVVVASAPQAQYIFKYRVRIWADLAKTARKQQIWDVARVAARFCLLYDDERWSLKRETRQTGEDEGGCIEEERNNEGRSSSGGGSVKKSEGQSKRSTYVTEEAKYNMEKDLLRILAEVHFLNAEV